MTLNKKQKIFIFTHVLSKHDLVKIFETDNTDWLCKQKVALKDGVKGWKDLYMNGEMYTSLNFPQNPGWQTILDDIDEFDCCNWCEEWFSRDELVHPNKRWTLCKQCYDYLVSREGPFHG